MTVRIVTDSTCDLPEEVIARHNISVVPLYINVGEQSYLDGIDISREEFYRKLPFFPTHPTTAVPSPIKFRAIYGALADEGADEILSIHISTALSAVADVASVAARETDAVPVTVFDSRQLSLGMGFMVERAAILAAEGLNAAQIVERLNDQVQRSHVFAALDTLEYLKRSGRMNRFVAGFGTLLQIKPLLSMFDGRPGTERVRTRDRAIRRVVERLREIGPLERVALVHANAGERIAALRSLAGELLPAGSLMVREITPVIGVHIGPGAAGFAAVTLGPSGG